MDKDLDKCRCLCAVVWVGVCVHVCVWRWKKMHSSVVISARKMCALLWRWTDGSKGNFNRIVRMNEDVTKSRGGCCSWVATWHLDVSGKQTEMGKINSLKYGECLLSDGGAAQQFGSSEPRNHAEPHLRLNFKREMNKLLAEINDGGGPQRDFSQFWFIRLFGPFICSPLFDWGHFSISNLPILRFGWFFFLFSFFRSETVLKMKISNEQKAARSSALSW